MEGSFDTAINDLCDMAQGLLTLCSMRLDPEHGSATNAVIAKLLEMEKGIEALEAIQRKAKDFIEFEKNAIERSKSFVALLEEQQGELHCLNQVIEASKQYRTYEEPFVAHGTPRSRSSNRVPDSPKSVASSSYSKTRLRKKSSGAVSDIQVNVPQMQMIDAEELKQLPSHVRGHLSVLKINRAIEEIQELLQEKYKVMSSSGKLSSGQMLKIQKYKEQESKETKGFYFFSNDDLKLCEHIRLDTTGKSILSLLRHTRRIKQVPGAKWIRYIVSDS